MSACSWGKDERRGYGDRCSQRNCPDPGRNHPTRRGVVRDGCDPLQDRVVDTERRDLRREDEPCERLGEHTEPRRPPTESDDQIDDQAGESDDNECEQVRR